MTFRKTEYKGKNMKKKKSVIQITKVLTTGALALALAPGLMPVHMVAAETVTETVNGERGTPGRQKVVCGLDVQVSTSHTARSKSGYEREARVIKEVNSTDKENEKRTKKADASADSGENTGEESKDSTTAEDITSGSVDESEDIQPSSDDSSADSTDSADDVSSVKESAAVPTEEEKETKEKKWYHVSIIDVAAQLTFAFVVALIGYGIFVRSKK